MFRCCRCGRLFKYKKLVFKCHAGGKPCGTGTVYHPFQLVPGADGVIFAFANEICEKKRDILLIRQSTFRRQIDAISRIWKRCMPPGVAGVVVQLVVYIPTEDTITKPRRAIGDRRKLIKAQVLASHHSVDICEANLDSPHSLRTININQRRPLTHGINLLLTVL